jgi:hypothetical protein
MYLGHNRGQGLTGHRSLADCCNGLQREQQVNVTIEAKQQLLLARTLTTLSNTGSDWPSKSLLSLLCASAATAASLPSVVMVVLQNTKNK